MDTTPTWVVGAGGLLGRHVVASLRRREVPVITGLVPWKDPAAAGDALAAGVRELAAAAAGGPWRLAWCAGAGVVATSAEDMERERHQLGRLLADLEGCSALTGPGAMFLASSAGGVYAGSRDSPPFTEESHVDALVPYGRTKLAMEGDVRRFAERTGTSVLVGRIANLYGPGQDLTKAQGLVSQLSRAHLTGQPLSIYVSLDTLRDYVYAADVGDLVAEALPRLRHRTDGMRVPVVVKVVATGASLTIGALVGHSTRLHRRRPRVVVKAPQPGSGQIRDLRLQSVAWPELDAHLRTPMVVGMARTAEDVALQLRCLSGPRGRSTGPRARRTSPAAPAG
jgi:UDP-glucose 4-epimerase